MFVLLSIPKLSGLDSKRTSAGDNLGKGELPEKLGKARPEGVSSLFFTSFKLEVSAWNRLLFRRRFRELLLISA